MVLALLKFSASSEKMSTQIQKPQAIIWGVTAHITPWATAKEQNEILKGLVAMMKGNGITDKFLHITKTTSNALLRIGRHVVEVGEPPVFNTAKPVYARIERIGTPLYVVVCDRGMPLGLRKIFKEKVQKIITANGLEFTFIDYIADDKGIMVPLSIAVQSESIVSNYTSFFSTQHHVPAISNIVGQTDSNLFKVPEKPKVAHVFPPLPAIGAVGTQKEIDAQKKVLQDYVGANFSCVSRKILDSDDYDTLHAALVECNKHTSKPGPFPKIDSMGKQDKRTIGKLRSSLSQANLNILEDRYCTVTGKTLADQAAKLKACWEKVQTMIGEPNPKNWPIMNPKKAKTSK